MAGIRGVYYSCTDGWNQQDATRFAGDHAACSCAESLAAREQQQGASGAAREPQQGTRLAVRDCPWITTPRPVQETNRYASYALTMAPRRQGEGIAAVQETNTRRNASSDVAMAPRKQDEATTPVQETNRDASSVLAMSPRRQATTPVQETNRDASSVLAMGPRKKQ